MVDANALLRAMMSGEGAGTSQQQLLAAIKKGRHLSPKRQMLLQLLETFAEQNRDAGEAEYDAVPIETVRDPAAESVEDRRRDLVDRIRDIIVGLAEDLAMARETNEALALALGACPECLGEDRSCPSCGGRGAPGEFGDPDPTLYRRFVAPAVKRVKRRGSSAAMRPGSVRNVEDVNELGNSAKGDDDA